MHPLSEIATLCSITWGARDRRARNSCKRCHIWGDASGQFYVLTIFSLPMKKAQTVSHQRKSDLVSTSIHCECRVVRAFCFQKKKFWAVSRLGPFLCKLPVLGRFPVARLGPFLSSYRFWAVSHLRILGRFQARAGFWAVYAFWAVSNTSYALGTSCCD